MSIKVPLWCKDAIPTSKGWVCARAGELLKSQKITPEQIKEFYADEVPVLDIQEDPVYEDFQVTSPQEFTEIDLNSDGKISEVEYLEYRASKYQSKKKSFIKRIFNSDK